MTPTDDLFRLIKSLTKSEKRYFRLYSERHSQDNNSLKLFDAIENRNEYDERELKSSLEGEKFVKNFRAGKKFLYDMLLDALASYHRKDSVNRELRTLLIQEEVLYDKGLYDQCRKLIQKAKELANKRENYVIMNDILDREYRVRISKRLSEISMEEIDEFFEEKTGYNDITKNISEYEHISAKIFYHYLLSAEVRDGEQMKKLKELMDLPIMKQKGLSFIAEGMRINTHIVYYEKIKDSKNAYKYASKLVRLFEEKPYFVSRKTNSYITALNNLLILQKNLKLYDECFITIEKMRNLEYNSELARLNAEYNTILAELNIYTDTGRFKEALNTVSEAEDFLKRNKEGLNNAEVMVIIYNMAVVYFGNEDYKASLKYINKLINSQNKTRLDILYFAHILHLMIHYELGSRDYLGYAVKGAFNFLSKKQAIHRTEEVILKFLKDIADKEPDEDMDYEFETLRKNLKELSKDPYEKSVLDKFDVLSWLESKLEKRKFADIVAEKAGTGIEI